MGDLQDLGKHRIEFHSSAGKRDVSSPSATQDRTTVWQAHVEKAAPPQLEATMVLDAGRLKEMMAKAASKAASERPSGIALVPTVESRAVRAREIGRLTIVAGRTDKQKYVLSSKLCVIGKSKMASIRLKRRFAPRVAASIHQREDSYFLVLGAGNIRMKINSAAVTRGQHELKNGDQFEVAGIVAMFGYENG